MPKKIDLEKLDDSEHLLDILISVEDVLDSLDAYVYSNWIEGEVVEGPIVRRHWITISLLYPYYKMPDPRAALRLLKHGVQVEFDREKRQEPSKSGANPQEPAQPTEWMITLTIPRRLIDTISNLGMELYDDEIDMDDVTAAQDVGLDNESQYQADEQLPGNEQLPGGVPEEPPPMQQPGPQGMPPRF